MATDRFHKDKKARAALRRAVARAHDHDGDRVRIERLDSGEGLEPVDALFERVTASYESGDELEVSAPISSTYLHPDPDRRALVDAWLESKAQDEAA